MSARCVSAFCLRSSFRVDRSRCAAEVIPPKPDRYFNDYASVVSKATALRFNEQLAQFERETSNQIVVAIYRTMQSESSSRGLHPAHRANLGRRPKRTQPTARSFSSSSRTGKMFIQTGYGLEGRAAGCDRFRHHRATHQPRFRKAITPAGWQTGIDR